MVTVREPDSLILQSIAGECREKNVAAVSPRLAEFLSRLIRRHGFTRVLEIGTGLGYSTIFLARAVGEDGRVVTIERLAGRAEIARDNFRRLGLTNIRSLEGEAHLVIPQLDDIFDFIFMDAAMGQYLEYFQLLLPKLAPGGMLAADNVLIENLVFRDRLAVPRRRRTMQGRLQNFLMAVRSDPRFVTRLLPLGDGLFICRRRLHQ
jgi:predicted O-methyltransferase YrrM